MNEKVFCKISDKDLGMKLFSIDNPIIRIGARGLVFNVNGEIAVFNKTAKNEYKLPGGGVEKDEDIEKAFLREIMEETGCHVVIKDYLGIIEEYKTKNNFVQKSYVFISEVVDDTNKLHLTKKEAEEGARLLWKSIDTSLELITNCKENLRGSRYDDLYSSIFMVERDKRILEYYLEKNTERQYDLTI